MKNYQFSIDLGPGISQPVGTLIVSPIDAGDFPPFEVPIENNPIVTLSLPWEDFSYGFALFIAESFHYNGHEQQAGDRQLQLCATFKATEKATVLNPPSTVASSFCFGRYMEIGEGGGIQIAAKEAEAKIMSGMKDNLVSVEGKLGRVIQSSPNGMQTNSFAMLNSLCNILCHCFTASAFYDRFLLLAGGKMPNDSPISAFCSLLKDPFSNAAALYELESSEAAQYHPSLSEMQLPEGHSPIPNQWSLTVKVNKSGAENFLIAGPGYIAFDRHDRVWITNNVTQGTPNSSAFAVVLNSDGSPAPFSPVFGGGLLGGGFGVTANATGDKVYLGNFGWGPIQCNPQSGSISVFTSEGEALSPSQGHVNKVSRAQGMAFDPDGNLWICSWGSQSPLTGPSGTVYPFESANSAIVVYPNGDPERAVAYEFDSPDHATFDVAIDQNGHAVVANGGNGEKGVASSVCKFCLEGGEIQLMGKWVSDYAGAESSSSLGYEGLRQVWLNGRDEIFVGGIASKRVVQLSPDLEFKTAFRNQITRPWGVTMDAEGTMFVANFSRQTPAGKGGNPAKLPGEIGVTVIRNEDEETAELLTLPTGGEEVMLANGFPLYGVEGPACHTPLMRMTASRIDQVGNLWAINNWKPDAKIDLSDNPGGDGLVIFIGVAAGKA